MQFRRFRIKLNRRLKRGQQQVEGLGQQAEQDIERYFFRRFEHLVPVRRFVIGWMLLVCLLIAADIGQSFLLNGYYQVLEPVGGGLYNEGVLGTFTTANPLYATSDADMTISRLIFASLFTYDQRNQLVGDLATGYSVDASGTVYTVHLKPHLRWQDGQPLTSRDVVFTYHLIQNPDAQSPLAPSWQNVSISAPNLSTVVFTLPNVLASFPYTLTNGIVPAHSLASIPAVDLRSADFNTVHPIGAGPFRWQGIQVSGSTPTTAEEQIALTPFAGYQGGTPKLQAFVVHYFADPTQLADAFTGGQLNGVSGLSQVPAGVKTMGNSVEVHNLLLSAGTYVFFKSDSGVLADQAVRQALVEGADVNQIIRSLGYPTRPVREPLLEGQLGYNKAYAQGVANPAAAKQLLTSDGWLVGKDGIRIKAGQQLSFTLVASDSYEYRLVSRQLSNQWRALGVNLQVELQPASDLATTLSFHNYDALLYGISIGVDPDVFVYWDSSQADVRSANRLNLSEFKNPTADESLESGRTRLDPVLRAIKYQSFLQVWQQQAPALGLYQPRSLYITNGLVKGLSDHSINAAADRLNNVQNWEIREAPVTR